jgi:hypothetical protein
VSQINDLFFTAPPFQKGAVAKTKEQAKHESSDEDEDTLMQTMKPALNSSSSEEDEAPADKESSPLLNELEGLQRDDDEGGAMLEGTMKVPPRSLRYEIDENLETMEGAAEDVPVTEDVQDVNIEVTFEGEDISPGH